MKRRTTLRRLTLFLTLFSAFEIEKTTIFGHFLLKNRHFGDPYGNRTHVTTVKGWCLNRLTMGPSI